jgi:hypothetical protein
MSSSQSTKPFFHHFSVYQILNNSQHQSSQLNLQRKRICGCEVAEQPLVDRSPYAVLARGHFKLIHINTQLQFEVRAVFILPRIVVVLALGCGVNSQWGNFERQPLEI